MSYDFSTLSPADFEDLTRDLVSANEGNQFEGFGPGPDGGIDGRHSTCNGDVILQAKHRLNSPFSALVSTIKRERKSIDSLSPTRYILATSQPLTPKKKAVLAEIIGPSLKTTSDILGQTEINSLLKAHPQVEQAHLKLWLSSTAVLNQLVNASSHSFIASSREDLEHKLRVYVPNPSLNDAQKTLETHHVAIISGAPGVGKTTLAQMLSYTYLNDGWEYCPIRDIDEAFTLFNSEKQQIFLFDDFLGKIGFDRSSLSAHESEFEKFVQRVQRSNKSRFILTTRSYIYEEARRVSDSIADPKLDISRFVLDVGSYTRKVRARILYNHLVASDLSTEYTAALINENCLPQIIDHKNYNPRIIEWMTDPILVDMGPPEYPEEFLQTLENPTEIWKRAFTEHIPRKAQHLLISMYFSRDDENIQYLRAVYEIVHAHLCAEYNVTVNPDDFDAALQILEGSFVYIEAQTACFVNPSVRDYLNSYLNQEAFLRVLATPTVNGTWAKLVWEQFVKVAKPNSNRSAIANLFAPTADFLGVTPLTRAFSGGTVRNDLELSERIRLIEQWRQESPDNPSFKRAIQKLVEKGRNQNYNHSLIESSALPGLIAYFRALADKDQWVEIVSNLELLFIQLVESYLDDYELSRVLDEIERNADSMSDVINAPLDEALRPYIEDDWDIVAQLDSEDAALEYQDRIIKFAAWTARDPAPTLSLIATRLEELEESEDTSYTPTKHLDIGGDEEFDDTELIALFYSALDLQ